MIQIGKLVNTHGVMGEVRVLSNSDFTDKRFAVGNTILIGKNTKLRIEKMSKHKTFIILKFEGIKNINDVLKFKGQNIYGELLDVKHLEEDEFLIQELVGMQVYHNETLLGNVDEVIDNPTAEILRVNKNILIPFRKQFVVNVFRDAKRIDVELLDGMLPDED